MGARGNQRGGEGCIAQCRREVSVRRRAAFRHAPEWGGVLAFNEFGHGTGALKPTPWGVVPKGEWTDHEDRLAAEGLQKKSVLVSVDGAGQAVQPTAQDPSFHHVKANCQGL